MTCLNRSVLAVFLGAMLLLSVSMSDSAFAEQKDSKKKSKTAEKKKLKPGFQPLKPKPGLESKSKVEPKSVKPQPAKPKLQTQGSTTSLDMSGKWEGIVKWSASFDYWDPNLGSYREICQYQGNFQMELQQKDNTVSGGVKMTNVEVKGGRSEEACAVDFATFSNINAKIFGSGFSGTLDGLIDVKGSATSDLIRGQISGSVGEAIIGGEFTGNRIFK
jgi:hypothetical protein